MRRLPTRTSVVFSVVALCAGLVVAVTGAPAGAATAVITGAAPDKVVALTTSGPETFEIACGGGDLSVGGTTYPAAPCADIGTITLSGDAAATDVSVFLADFPALHALTLLVGSAPGGEDVTLYGPFPAGLTAGTATVNAQTLRLNIVGSPIADTITVSGATVVAGGSVTSTAPNTALSIFGGPGNDTIDASLAATPFTAVTLDGGDDDDALTGTSGADLIQGGAGSDQISGGAGDDAIRPGSEMNAFVDGGDGIDTLDFATVASPLTVDLAGGSSSHVASILNIENVLGGTSGDTITGTAADNLLDGGSSDDVLIGGGGNDSLLGGAGTDVLRPGDGLANVVNGGTGIDTISYVDVATDVVVNIATSSGTGLASLVGIENVTGGSGNDVVTGNSAGNLLQGGPGNDQLFGGGGIDVLQGGADDDVLRGGSAADSLDGGTGFDTAVAAGTAGTDTVTLTAASLPVDGTDALVAIDVINVDFLGGDDQVTVVPAAGVAFVLEGGTGTDRLMYDGSAVTGEIYGATTITANGVGTVTYSGFETAESGVVPEIPTAVTAMAGDAMAAVMFTPGIANGQPVAYAVTASSGGWNATGTSSPITVTGLTNGVVYTFTVIATNPTGASAPSLPSNAVTPTAAVVPPDPNPDPNPNPGALPSRGTGKTHGWFADSAGLHEVVAYRPVGVALVAVAPTALGTGSWSEGGDGGVFTAGDAQFYGSTGGMRLNAPVIGLAPTARGDGYWLAATDGGVFAFGAARFAGSMGGVRLNQPIVGAATACGGLGYYLVASDGGVFAFGGAAFYGSLGGLVLNAPIVGITPTCDGYRLVAADGGVFTFGALPFYGSLGGQGVAGIEALVPTMTGNGYWLTDAAGGAHGFGAAG